MVSKVVTNEIGRGEFVKLKQQFKNSYPTVPASMALKIEDIQNDEAIVVFIDFKANKVCRQRILMSALYNAL
ncbi:MAG TPA: hypothetical protein VLJ41_08770 [Segetibacter sp.]|nr:hypothetical protein [Segetibacter sp.]